MPDDIRGMSVNQILKEIRNMPPEDFATVAREVSARQERLAVQKGFASLDKEQAVSFAHDQELHDYMQDVKARGRKALARIQAAQ